MISVQQKIAVLTDIGASSLVEQTINKLIAMQIARYQQAIQQITPDILAFEQRFQMSSAESYQRFNAGELGDSADVFEWVSLYENVALYQQRIHMLRGAMA